ncbi:hypothetical protein K439DRAFT_372229 [Ramaria rubella]|nr:hypothetical protein K439DRAFT_372229 [Ramaria rubella]
MPRRLAKGPWSRVYSSFDGYPSHDQYPARPLAGPRPRKQSTSLPALSCNTHRITPTPIYPRPSLRCPYLTHRYLFGIEGTPTYPYLHLYYRTGPSPVKHAPGRQPGYLACVRGEYQRIYISSSSSPSSRFSTRVHARSSPWLFSRVRLASMPLATTACISLAPPASIPSYPQSLILQSGGGAVDHCWVIICCTPHVRPHPSPHRRFAPFLPFPSLPFAAPHTDPELRNNNNMTQCMDFKLDAGFIFHPATTYGHGRHGPGPGPSPGLVNARCSRLLFAARLCTLLDVTYLGGVVPGGPFTLGACVRWGHASCPVICTDLRLPFPQLGIIQCLDSALLPCPVLPPRSTPTPTPPLTPDSRPHEPNF